MIAAVTLDILCYEGDLDLAAHGSIGDGTLITADTGVASRMPRKERDDAVAMHDAVGNGAPPVVASLDLVLVESHFKSTILQVGFDPADKRFVTVAPAIIMRQSPGRFRV